MSKKISYKDAGVDRDLGDQFVENIKSRVMSTYNADVLQGVGGFASLYRSGDRLLAAGTDGVGTKLKLAQQLNLHDTIGIDLVAMCANDIICTGARPLFFLDYFATGKLELSVSEAIIKGIVNGCLESELALIGGETAEMPGLYQDGEYDLAGFAVGELMPEQLLDGRNFEEGDHLLSLASSGFHSNGYSLVRKLIKSEEIDLLKEALTPTKLYWKLIKKLKAQGLIKGMAHMTGSGVLNIPRMNFEFDYYLENVPALSKLPKVVQTVCERSGLEADELYQTFNMGMGMVVVTDKPLELESYLMNEKESFEWLGLIKSGKGEVHLKNNSRWLKF